MVVGRSLELGSGTGNFKEYVPDIITSDIVSLPWLDLTLDAQSLPLKDKSVDNIILFDVLHHLENPVLFFNEALRMLKHGGRIILMEPYVSIASFLIYRFLHSEPLVLDQDPYQVRLQSFQREPFDSNQAIPTLIFMRYRDRFHKMYPEFQLITMKRLGFFAYPMSGGFDHFSLLPLMALRPLLLLEELLCFLDPVLAFRIFVVLEKRAVH